MITMNRSEETTLDLVPFLLLLSSNLSPLCFTHLSYVNVSLNKPPEHLTGQWMYLWPQEKSSLFLPSRWLRPSFPHVTVGLSLLSLVSLHCFWLFLARLSLWSLSLSLSSSLPSSAFKLISILSFEPPSLVIFVCCTSQEREFHHCPSVVQLLRWGERSGSNWPKNELTPQPIPHSNSCKIFTVSTGDFPMNAISLFYSLVLPFLSAISRSLDLFNHYVCASPTAPLDLSIYLLIQSGYGSLRISRHLACESTGWNGALLRCSPITPVRTVVRL